MSMLTLNSCGEIPYNNTMFNFYMDQELVDTELILANGKIKTHSLILATQSKRLYDMLISQNGQKKTVMLTQYSKETMRIILEYMYRGVVTYPTQNDEDVKEVIDFLGVSFKTDSKDKCKVEKTEETDDSIIEVKKQETLIEISDNETETNDNTIKNISKSQNVSINQEKKNENTSLGPLDESYDFLTNSSDTKIEGTQKSNESEKSPDFMKTKERKRKNVVKNPFSDYVTVKKSEESVNNSQSQLSNHHNDQITSKSQSETEVSNNKRHKCEKEQLNGQSVSENRENKDKSAEKPTSTVPNKQGKVKSDTNIWINKKKNPNNISKKYCLMCQKNKINIKCHIRIFHKKLTRLPNHICDKCSKSFFFEEFLNCHKEICK
ncbi:uncharacterized protein LOC130903387 [Diorhabda carinulata]|uniref:uncharacterized protein LOC130903387 n=1 Tax=Diorhabda carinulata TaxID=1163345 RepID=UPI0025A029FB|nr:uncharacterized protein LOC130903387 [Diorhabda carinulata]